MKYTTFARLRAGVAALALAGAAFVGCRAVSGPQVPSPGEGTSITSSPGFTAPLPAPTSIAVSPKSKKPEPRTAPASAGGNGLTTWQQEVMDFQKQPLTNGETKGGSRKWVVNGGGMRAEFRSDTDKGATHWNRVKIDLNGNKRDDERWDFKTDGSIKRRVSPNDDENFTEEYRWKSGKWVKKG